MTIPKVTNMNSPKTGEPVANQYIIYTNEGRYFQSYNSVIAFVPNGNYEPMAGDYRTQLDPTYWDYSRTTSKYRNEFLGENTQETRKKIKDGQYKLVELN